jgi:phosphoserine phosphatase
LDGTLIQSDLLLESTALLLRDKPWMALALPFWTLQGRATVKRRIAERVKLAADTLPYNGEVLRWLREEKAKGRCLVLATAAEMQLATAVADHAGLFDHVLGSDGKQNLKGAKKLDALRARYGADFDYAGDSSADLPIWRICREAILVNPSRRTLREATESARVGRIFESRRHTAWLVLRELRVPRWAKNLLIFVPPIVVRQFGRPDVLYRAFVAFVAFSLLASAMYIVNDIADLESDRRDPARRSRPFASGALSLKYAFLFAPTLIVAAFALTAFLPVAAAAVLALYFVVALAYSLWLKRKPLIGPVMIVGFYALRIVMGWASGS